MSAQGLMRSLLDDVGRAVRAAPIFHLYVAATLAVAGVVGLMTVEVIDLGMGHFGTISHRTHDVAFGLLFTTSVAGVAAQIRRPGENVAALVMALVPPAALWLAGALAGAADVLDRNPYRYLLWMLLVVALLHPAGRAFFATFRPGRVSWPLLAVAGVAAPPLILFAVSNIRLQRTVSDEHAAMGHYAFMAASTLTVLTVAVLVALRPAGWRLASLAAGLPLPVIGVTSLLYPDATSSIDPAWAFAGIGWGIAFVATALTTSDVERAASADAPVTPEPTGVKP